MIFRQNNQKLWEKIESRGRRDPAAEIDPEVEIVIEKEGIEVEVEIETGEGNFNKNILV